MFGQKGGVVNDALVFGVVYHFYGNELSAKREDIQFRAHPLVLLKYFRQNCALFSPLGKFEHPHSVFGRLLS